MLIHLGIDDTDSHRMGCTTYVTSLLIEEISKLGAIFIDYPSIVRLNPNIPWKTRGNGATCLRFKLDEGKFDLLKEVTKTIVRENSDLASASTDPGIVFYKGEIIPELSNFAQKAIKSIVSLKEAMDILKSTDSDFIKFKEGRGLIGALAAIGERLLHDHTFELIAYRLQENRGMVRKLDFDSVVKANMLTMPITFDNVDFEKKRVLITPHGPDPILYGIRGESPEIVKKAHELIKPLEEIERWTLFKTNHGTDSHLHEVRSIDEIRCYESVILRGRVASYPISKRGGHVFFKITDGVREIECAAYEPTGLLNDVAKLLIPGDIIEVYGGVKPSGPHQSMTINLEKLRVIELKPIVRLVNPSCPLCRKKMKSAGRGKGFKCEKCGFKDRKAEKCQVEVARRLRKHLYISSPRAHRHLMKPYSRYGREKETVTTFRQLDVRSFYWSKTLQ